MRDELAVTDLVTGPNTGTSGSRYEPEEITMTRLHRHIRRLAAAAALAGALLVSTAAAPTALAKPGPPWPWQLNHPLLPPRHWTWPVSTVPAHAVVTGGLPGWQIALVAAAAALAAAAVAVLLWTGPGPGPRAARRSPVPRLPGIAGPRQQAPVRAVRQGAVLSHDQISRRAA